MTSRLGDQDLGPGEERVLVLAPVGRDAGLVLGVLARENIASHPCADAEELCRELAQGAGAVLLTEDALSSSTLSRLRAVLENEPPWSDIPLVVCTSSGDAARVIGGDGWFGILEGRGHLTLLERPIRIRTLVTAVRSALRARRRQYQVRRLLGELADAATERERLLAAEREARANAEAASRAKDEFLATLSHELRTPMNAIVGWTMMLRQGTMTADKQRQALEIIDRNARAQTQLIQDLLDVSAIVNGKMRLNVQPVDLGAVVALALETIRPAAGLKDVRLVEDVDPSARHIRGDADRLLQITSNLLTNAVKFTPRGGEVRITVARAGDDAVRLSVSDNGRGIEPDFLLYVFDRFRQADASTTRRHGGLGLGLAIVRHLAELHGGTVEAYSEGEGKGATFAITLPIVSSLTSADAGRHELLRAAARGHAEIETPPELRGARVLVVDDQGDARELIAAVLERCGAVVAQVGSAEEALSRFDELAPQVLVTDIAMPGEDGYALIRRVRERPPERGGNVPAVALTAFARTEDASRAVRAGFDVHLTKPVDPAELVSVIARLAAAGPRSRAAGSSFAA